MESYTEDRENMAKPTPPNGIECATIGQSGDKLLFYAHSHTHSSRVLEERKAKLALLDARDEKMSGILTEQKFLITSLRVKVDLVRHTWLSGFIDI